MLLIDIIAFESRLLDLFRTVFPYRNKLNRHIMETEKVHSIKHCHVDVTNYANPMNCCTDGCSCRSESYSRSESCSQGACGEVWCLAFDSNCF